MIRELFRFGLPAALQGIAMNIADLISLATWTSVGLMGGGSAVEGQNLGARKPDRRVQAAHADVLSIGAQLLAFLSVSGLFITTALPYTGSFQGTGDTKSPLYITLISQFALPIRFLTIVQLTRQLVPSDVWLAIVMGHALRCVLSVWQFRQGKWRGVRVGVAAVRGRRIRRRLQGSEHPLCEPARYGRARRGRLGARLHLCPSSVVSSASRFPSSTTTTTRRIFMRRTAASVSPYTSAMEW